MGVGEWQARQRKRMRLLAHQGLFAPGQAKPLCPPTTSLTRTPHTHNRKHRDGLVKARETWSADNRQRHHAKLGELRHSPKRSRAGRPRARGAGPWRRVQAFVVVWPCLSCCCRRSSSPFTASAAPPGPPPVPARRSPSPPCKGPVRIEPLRTSTAGGQLPILSSHHQYRIAPHPPSLLSCPSFLGPKDGD